jgi:dihydrofolate synthase/folylpolyglutamate synthase
MAFDYFYEQNVDIAIIEVGLGGRLDSTNIIMPLISVITNIGMDHTQFLGNTLKEIAFEKAGIIKPGVPVVIGETQTESKPVFIEVSKKNEAPIVFADAEISQTFESNLKGIYQKNNINTAVQVLNLISMGSFNISETHIKSGLHNVEKNTGLRGRWEVLQDCPRIICDIAHNKEGLTYVMAQLNNEHYRNLHVVFGTVNDKDLNSILPLMPKQAMYYFCKANIERGLDVEKLKRAFNDYGLIGNAFSSVNEALQNAKIRAQLDDLIYVGGSTFVVSEIL